MLGMFGKGENPGYVLSEQKLQRCVTWALHPLAKSVIADQEHTMGPRKLTKSVVFNVFGALPRRRLQELLHAGGDRTRRAALRRRLRRLW